MQRFGLVLPFLDPRSSCRLVCVCRSAKAELLAKRELALTCWSEAQIEVWEGANILDRLFHLDCTSFSFRTELLIHFLSSRRLTNLRLLHMPRFAGALTCRFPSSLTALTLELGDGSIAELGELPRLVSLKLYDTFELDLTLLPTVCPGLTTLDLDPDTSKGCTGELCGLDFLKTLRVENWWKRVPLTVLHLEVGVQSVFESQVKAPSNIAEIARNLVTLACSFPWPGIEEWPRLESLKLHGWFRPLVWRIKRAPSLHTFEGRAESTNVGASPFPKLRTLRVSINHKHLATQPSKIRDLRLTSFDPRCASLAEFTGLQSLELHGTLFVPRSAPEIVFAGLQAFTFVNSPWDRTVSFDYLEKFPDLRKLRIEAKVGGFSKPIPMLRLLESIECDFFHETLFQPRVKHLRITGSDRRLPNSAILTALENCERLESLQVPLRPGLESLILERFPMLVLTKTMTLEAEQST